MEELDPEVLAELKVRAKRQIRVRMRALRGAYPEAVLEQFNQAISQRLIQHEHFRAATSVGLFWPILEQREVDLRAVDALARSAGKRVYYPFMQPEPGRTLTGFRRVDQPTLLAERGRGFLEPPTDAPLAERTDIELIVVPALAVSADGDRVGYGAGFYDATLPDFCPPARTIVVAYDFQLLAELPTTANDVRCDLVITERRAFANGREA